MTTNISSALGKAFGTLSASRILTAAAILVICLIIIRLLMKLIRRLVSQSKLDERVQRYVISGIRLVLYIVAGIITAECLEIDMTSLVALLSVGSLGITLAAEDILGNVAGGLVILSSHPFSIGDFIEADATSGTVEEINLNHTKLITPEGVLVMLPNKELASSKVSNYTLLGRRRVTRKVTASYDAPTETVKAACREAMGKTANLLPDPAPVVRLTDYGASSIEYTLRCWAKTEDYWQVYEDLREALRESFAAHGVEMTYDHLNVHVVQ